MGTCDRSTFAPAGCFGLSDTGTCLHSTVCFGPSDMATFAFDRANAMGTFAPDAGCSSLIHTSAFASCIGPRLIDKSTFASCFGLIGTTASFAR